MTTKKRAYWEIYEKGLHYELIDENGLPNGEVKKKKDSSKWEATLVVKGSTRETVDRETLEEAMTHVEKGLDPGQEAHMKKRPT
jgi:hypothetical protein